MRIERILITVDGSKTSEGVFEAARRLVLHREGTMTLLQVGQSGQGRAEAQRLDATACRFEHLGRHQSLVVLPVFREGEDPAQVILEEIPQLKPDVLAMATHGRTGLSRWVVGSTTEAVLRKANVPVLVCNEHAARVGTRVPYQRLLVPLDGSESAALSAPLIATLAKTHSAEVVLLRVEPTALKPGTQRHAEVRDYLGRYADVLERAGARSIELMAVRGEKPAAAILETIANRRADLVVMGTQGKSGLERLRFGSVAEEVLRHAPCPVLLRRAVEQSEAGARCA